MKKIVNRNRTGVVFGLLLALVVMTGLAACSNSSPTQSISGQVTAGGAPLSGVAMTLSGKAFRTTTTDANGNYGFSDVEEGTYLLTPSFAGSTFTPANRYVYLSGMDAIAFNFDSGVDNRIASKNHTVYAKADGTLWAWGRNDSGQLGDGTTTSRATPVKIAGLSNIRSVAAGYDHTVVLTTDGRVYSWGNVKNLFFHVNTCPIETLQELSNSDILLASRSSYSYVAGILKKKGVVLQHTFWHVSKKSWIPVKKASNILTHKDTILTKIQSYNDA